jgi:hypothetical protein
VSDNLRLGAVGQQVRDLQAALNHQMSPPLAPITIDGRFGRATYDRLREFQRRCGLTPDGSVGPQTRRALFSAVNVAVRAHVSSTSSTNASPARTPNLLGSDLQFRFPATPDSPQLGLGNIQIQGGYQRTLPNWLGPTSASFGSILLAAQLTWVQRRFSRNLEGPHLELTVGAQFALNLDPTDSRWSAQGFAQITAADLIAPPISGRHDESRRFHLISPFIQVAATANFNQAGATIGFGIGNTISFDIVANQWMLFVQGMLACSVDLTNGNASVTPSVFAGVTWQYQFPERHPRLTSPATPNREQGL